MTNEKALDFWQSYFDTKQPKEKFDILCSDSLNNSELEASLVSDLLDYINNSKFKIGESNLDSVDKITVCKNCNDEVSKSRFYDHIKSEKHRGIEKYFSRKCMTYCERCDKEIENDVCREHIIFKLSHSMVWRKLL